ncbi:MAG: HNH endonuclease [Trueperaceae bacterium]|nr:HNH endonuclease [Trueperaceae bacterium]
MLTDPFFFPPGAWIDPPRDWPRNTVQGKRYDLTEGEGARVWAQVQERLRAHPPSAAGDEVPALLGSREERWARIRARLGQGGFRASVTDAYRYRCAITGERTLPVLEAAHIRPHALRGPNDVRNGLLLRSDLHILFDRGYLTVDPQHRVHVSRRIREEFENGREYYRFDGAPLANLPRPAGERPERTYLTWHNEHVFEAGAERAEGRHMGGET